MTDFDKKIKYMARQEKVEVPPGFDERMDRLIEQSRSEAMKVKSRRRFYRFSTMAAVLAGSLVVALGVYAAVNWASYDWDGNKIPTEPVIMDEGVEETSFTFSFPDKESYDERLPDDFNPEAEIARIKSPGSGFWSIIEPLRIRSEAELRERLVKAKQRFRIPEWLPGGYQFKEAALHFYLSEEYISHNTDPTRTKELENGEIVEIFAMPPEYQQHISEVYISYQNDHGELLSYGADLLSGSLSFSATDQVRTSVPEIDGYDKVLYMDDVPGDSDNQNRLYLKQDIAAVPFFFESDFDGQDSLFQPMSYNAITYSIESNILEEDDLIRIAKELKPVE